jgi:hypothetical protein
MSYVSWGVIVVAAALTGGAALFVNREDPPYQPDYLDRRITVQQLQTCSDYAGLEAKFDLDGWEERTLLMTGTTLCDKELPQLLPGNMWRLIKRAGFQWVRCEYGNNTKLAVPVK